MGGGRQERLAILPSAIEHGRLYDEAIVKRVFAAFFEAATTVPDYLLDESDRPIFAPVLFAPFAAENERGQSILPLMIPGILDEAGTMYPHHRLLPWIPKRLLTPLPPDDVKIGADDVRKAFYQEHAADLRQEDVTWDEMVGFGFDLLEAVGGEQWQDALAEQGYGLREEAFVMPLIRNASFNANVDRVYTALLEEEQLPEMFVNFVSAETPVREAPLQMPDWLNPAMLHLGSVSAEFPLSPSQREALYNFLILDEGHVIPINGPPGTGKTTLLQSVVASLYVDAALRDGDPPVIVVSSTNNQAVTNVIESFGRLSTIERWLPVASFGLYLVNDRKKQAEASKSSVLWTDRSGNGFHKSLEKQDVIANWTDRFLDQCESLFGQPIGHLDTAITQLHNQLKRRAETMHRGLESAYTAAHAALEQQRALDAYGNFAQRRSFLAQAIGENNTNRQRIEDLREAWQTHLNQAPWWQLPVRWAPSVQRANAERNAGFVALHLPDFEGVPTTRAVNTWFDALEMANSAELEALHGQRAEMQSDADGLNEAQLAWEEWRQAIGAPDCEVVDLLLDGNNPHPLHDWLDVTLRHELLQLATHYWEGRWLQAAQQYLKRYAGDADPRMAIPQLRRWQRYAMLTPCMVTTMQTGPSFFEYDNEDEGDRRPLLDAIDLLVVDEAGQVLPELSGAMFGLARQALVVGDTQQIEPIWSVPHMVDIENLYDYGLISSDGEVRRGVIRGMRASRGSVMQMAQHCSPWQKHSFGTAHYEPGLFLAEHRRSVPEIIGYCNELAYGGALIPSRPSLRGYPWPHLGMVAVRSGSAEIIGASRRNLREAEAIMAWLNRNRVALEDYYDDKLENIIAVITPFAAQKRVVQDLLTGQKLGNMTVGTVHALQGGERPVVLFSPVYDLEHEGRYFFDANVNMLNVAVSRAQDCFLVIGDPDIFDPHSNTPSGLLARYLFDD